MTQFVRVIDTKRCMGCRSCVAACAVENYYTPDAAWNVMMEVEDGAYPNVRKTFTTMNCMHCENPSCKAACDLVGAKAISKNEYGVVLIDYEKCIGCGYCAAVCPYGVPQLNKSVAPLVPEKGPVGFEAIPASERHPTHRKRANVAEKCTFCWHKLEKAIAEGKKDRIGKDQAYTPTCDLVCPTQARFFGDLDDPDSTVARVIAEKRATRLKQEFGTGPRVYYVLEGDGY